jgi:hypothetical protein
MNGNSERLFRSAALSSFAAMGAGHFNYPGVNCIHKVLSSFVLIAQFLLTY